MSDNKYIAIGDIHGCLLSLKVLLEKAAEYGNRKFIFLGDYIDRGPDPKGVVDLLLEFDAYHDCVFLRGNHEQMLLDAYEYRELDLWLMNGGKSTLKSYDTMSHSFKIPEPHLEFYKKTRMYYETADYLFVHAGISPAKTIRESLDDDNEIQGFLWERSHLNAFETPWEKTVVFGHTPRSNPLKKDKMIGIDTGCVYEGLGYGKLTAVLLPESEFIQQTCLDH